MYYNQIGKRPVCDISMLMIPFDVACAFYEQWMGSVCEANDIEMSVSQSRLKLERAIRLVSRKVNKPPYRCVFVEMSANCTLYFDNSAMGGTVVPVSSMISEYLTCDVMHVMDYEPEETSLMFELYRSSAFPVRGISWIDDGGGLECIFSGDRLIEETAVFPEPLKKLNSDTLFALVAAFGGSLDWAPDLKVRCCVFDKKFV